MCSCLMRQRAQVTDVEAFNTLHVKSVCLLIYTSIVSTNLRQLERFPAVWSDCYTAT